MRLEFKNDLFYANCSYKEKDIVRRAGFVWDAEGKSWVTPYAMTACKLCTDKTTRDIIIGRVTAEEETIKQSKAIWSDVKIPAPEGLSYLPYQKAGIKFIMERNNVLLADQMGLGKTIQVLGAINAFSSSVFSFNILIVCPASLKLNWLHEFNKWNVTKLTAKVVDGSSTLTGSNVYIMNYDILKKHMEDIKGVDWDILILDEAHYLKNDKAQRTKIVCGDRKYSGIKAKRKIALTGTPIVNRPIELYPVLRYLAPNGWSTKFEYAKKYCAAKKTKWGWDYSGSSNSKNLQEKLRSTIMCRRMKEEVLTDLPPKIKQVLEFNIINKGIGSIREKESSIWRKIRDKLGIYIGQPLSGHEYKEAIKLLQGGDPLIFEEISSIRKETGLVKLPMVIDYLDNCIKNNDKIVCFCHHKEVVEGISSFFKEVCVTLTGSTPLKKREKAVRDFQTKQQIKLFIGNIQAAGVGLTLTASSHVVFAELSWVSGRMEQASDRCHRIGQKDSVLVQYLVLQGSIDAMMAKAFIHKQEIIDKVVNSELGPKLMEMLK